MVKPLVSALLILAAAGCGSSGGQGSASVPTGEVYGGHLIAAVLPITGAGVYRGEGLRLQQRMAQAIAESGTFADVLLPGSMSEGHEGEVVIRATVEERSGGDGGKIALRVVATRKTTGAVGLDRTYKGKCRRCGTNATGAALADAMGPINRDLKRRFHEPAVY